MSHDRDRRPTTQTQTAKSPGRLSVAMTLMEKIMRNETTYSSQDEKLAASEAKIQGMVRRNPGDPEPLRMLASVQQQRAEVQQLKQDVDSYNANYLPAGEDPIRLVGINELI